MKVKIKRGKPGSWYEGKVGKVYSAFTSGNNLVWVNVGKVVRPVNKEDCEIINTQPK